ncbi:MAG: NAD-dependent epimerase/dehydratase family protein [Chloroflexota bacterium]|nr:NAD-dependent epimerase/dehydratase family protein [Chloroflexota bacterium]
MRALVTGATGFLGSHIVERLLAQGHEVRALARPTSDTSFLKSTGASIVFGDVTDHDTLQPAVAGADVVFHTAARVTPGWGSWPQFQAAIVRGTENVLGAAAGAGCTRFVYMSSGGVYGRACQGDTPVCESTPCDVVFGPDTYYESAKLRAEAAVLDHKLRGKMDVTILRPAAVYGPRDRLVSDHLYRHLSLPVVVWPNGAEARYSIVFASDAADCAIAAAAADVAAGQAYNVATPEPVRFRDFAATMLRAMGGRRLQFSVPYGLGHASCAAIEAWSKLARVQGMPYLTRSGLRFLRHGMVLDGSRARHELGWEPKVTIEQGTRRYVQWRRSQRETR